METLQFLADNLLTEDERESHHRDTAVTCPDVEHAQFGEVSAIDREMIVEASRRVLPLFSMQCL